MSNPVAHSVGPPRTNVHNKKAAGEHCAGPPTIAFAVNTGANTATKAGGS